MESHLLDPKLNSFLLALAAGEKESYENFLRSNDTQKRSFIGALIDGECQFSIEALKGFSQRGVMSLDTLIDCLTYAFKRKHPNTMAWINEFVHAGYSNEEINSSDYELLYWACMKGYADAVKIFMNLVDPNVLANECRKDTRQQLLRAACLSGSCEIFKIVSEKIAVENTQIAFNLVMICTVRKNGNFKTLKEVLRIGSKIAGANWLSGSSLDQEIDFSQSLVKWLIECPKEDLLFYREVKKYGLQIDEITLMQMIKQLVVQIDDGFVLTEKKRVLASRLIKDWAKNFLSCKGCRTDKTLDNHAWCSKQGGQGNRDRVDAKLGILIKVMNGIQVNAENKDLLKVLNKAAELGLLSEDGQSGQLDEFDEFWQLINAYGQLVLQTKQLMQMANRGGINNALGVSMV